MVLPVVLFPTPVFPISNIRRSLLLKSEKFIAKLLKTQTLIYRNDFFILVFFISNFHYIILTCGMYNPINCTTCLGHSIYHEFT